MNLFARLSTSSLRGSRHFRKEPTTALHVDELEPRLVPARNQLALDFAAPHSPKAAGFVRVSDPAYNASRGFGFKNAARLQIVDRGGGGALTRDFLKGSVGIFRANLTNGMYVVTAFFGDKKGFHDSVHIYAENAFAATAPSTVPGQFVSKSFLVHLNDRQLNLNFLGNNGSKFALNGLKIVPWSLTANAGPDIAAQEGAAVTFHGSAASPSLASSLWDFGDGSTAAGTLTPSKTYAEQGTYQVTLTVTDSFGFERQDVTTVTVNNAAPTATFSNGGPVNEGSSRGVSFSNPFDPSPADTLAGFRYSYDFDNNGSFEVSNSTSASATVPASLLADGPGSRTVRGRIIDKDGGFTDYWTSININNVAPSVTLGNFSGTTSDPTSVSATVTDPSSTDAAAGFTYLWTFGDGATSTQATPSHQYLEGGTYQVSVRVRDKDGAETTRSSQASITENGTNPYSTPYETFPNFGANPTIVSIASGDWSSASTWSGNRVPAANDVVAINANTSVRFDVSMASADAVTTIVIKDDGRLFFATDRNTKLFVSNLVVLPGGELEIGTPANPVPETVTAEINFADKPLDSSFDPSQWGNGLIALGKVTMIGAAKPDTFIRLAVEPRVGHTTLTLSEPATGWRPGDKLILPDSHLVTDFERNTNYDNQLETVTIQSISANGLVITLTAALAENHLGARDINGVLEFLPHVANRTRNVIVKSENSSGNRGHVVFTHRADVNVQYVQFGGLGRSTGANQEDRNPIQFRHLIGPTTPQSNGHQYTFVGNSVFCAMNPMPFIWGINVNDSHYGLIADNVLFNWAGAAFVTKTGSETGNVIERNMVIRTNGDALRVDDDAGAGSGFWFRGPDNYVRDNVATAINSEGDDIYSYGFNYYGRYVGTVNVPVAPGSSQRQDRNMNNTPIRQFENNEVYGASISGLSLWWLGTEDDSFYANAQESVVKDFKVWHHGFAGLFSYPGNRVTIDGMVVRGNVNAIQNDVNFNNVGIYFSDYMGHNFVVKNANIQNVRNGIYAPINVGRVTTMNTTIIENSFLANVTNIIVSPPRSVNGSGDLSPKRLEVRNVVFAHPPSISQNQWTDIEMDFVLQDVAGTSNLNVADLVFVYDYNGDPDDDFQVFYDEQAPADAVDRALFDGKVKPI